MHVLYIAYGMTERGFPERINGWMNKGEYGLLYCTVCGEALEIFYPQNSIMKGGKHPRQCACERKVREEEEKYRKEKEHQELVERNRRICFEEKEMMNWIFQKGDKDNPVVKSAKDYVCN